MIPVRRVPRAPVPGPETTSEANVFTPGSIRQKLPRSKFSRLRHACTEAPATPTITGTVASPCENRVLRHTWMQAPRQPVVGTNFEGRARFVYNRSCVQAYAQPLPAIRSVSSVPASASSQKKNVGDFGLLSPRSPSVCVAKQRTKKPECMET